MSSWADEDDDLHRTTTYPLQQPSQTQDGWTEVTTQKKKYPRVEKPVMFGALDREYRIFDMKAPTVLKLEGHTFISAFHAVEYVKCDMFGNKETVDQVLQAKNTADIIKVSKSLDQFDSKAWQDEQEDVVWNVLEQKFKQNETFRKQLLATNQRPIYLMNVKWWGTDDTLTGANVMGKMLMDLRSLYNRK